MSKLNVLLIEIVAKLFGMLSIPFIHGSQKLLAAVLLLPAVYPAVTENIENHKTTEISSMVGGTHF